MQARTLRARPRLARGYCLWIPAFSITSLHFWMSPSSRAVRSCGVEASRFDAELEEAGGDVGLGEDVAQRAVQRGDDLRRRALGREEGVPRGHVEAGDAGLRDARHVGQDLGASRARRRQRPDALVVEARSASAA